MSVARYIACEDTALNARLFLWDSLGLNGYAVGDGWATNPETGQRMEEHLTGNVPLASVPGHRSIDLDVRLAGDRT